MNLIKNFMITITIKIIIIIIIAIIIIIINAKYFDIFIKNFMTIRTYMDLLILN